MTITDDDHGLHGLHGPACRQAGYTDLTHMTKMTLYDQGFDSYDQFDHNDYRFKGFADMTLSEYTINLSNPIHYLCRLTIKHEDYI